jgi:osmoprotectant transport system substrate-binding protein
VPIVRQATLDKFPELRGALADLGGKITGQDMRHLNYLVDAEQRDVPVVIREFRQAHKL